MAEIINSSFIPKKEFNKKKTGGRGLRLNIFFLISLMIFLTTIISSAGIYLWKEDLKKTNKGYEESFASKGEDLGIESIKTFSALDKRISSAKEILKNHYDILEIFSYLEKNTLGDSRGEVTLTDLTIKEKQNIISVEAKGKTLDLTNIQIQSKGYNSNPNISDLVLSDVTKSNRGAYWEFNLYFNVDKKFLTERSL